MQKKRKYELSLMNIICCFVVIFIHTNSEMIVAADKSSLGYMLSFVLWQAASFVVYGFIFLSGIKQFLNKGDDFSIAKFYSKRLTAVVIPYCLWVIAYYIYDCATGIENFSISTLTYYMYSGDYIGHFYFVILIIQFYLLMPLWIKLFKKVSPILMIPASIFITIIFGQYLPNVVDVFVPGYYFRFADRTFTSYFMYWVMGAYIGMYYDRAKELLVKNRPFIYSVQIFMTAFAIAIAYYNSVAAKGYLWIENLMSFYRFITVISLFTVCIKTPVKKICSVPLVRCIDKSSYIIYLCHCLIMKEVTRLMGVYGIENLNARYAIRFFSVYIISIGLCILYTVVKNAVFNKKSRKI